MENKQTAVEWLENILHDFIHPEHGAEFFPFVEKAKAMEKEQIVDAYNSGGDHYTDFGAPIWGIDYYKETYGN